MDLPKELRPLVIRGGAFTFRTFHGQDAWFGGGQRQRSVTLDRLMTVTLPAVSGEDHTIVPTMEVKLYDHTTILRHQKRAGTYVDGRKLRHRKEPTT